ncbi:hypothetical protein D3C81_1907360 [compost metagenome]
MCEYLLLLLEAVAVTGREEIVITQRVVLRTVVEGDVAQVDLVLLVVVEAQTDTFGEAAFVELPVHGYPFHVLAQEHERRSGYRRAEEVGVVQLPTQAIAPGEIGDIAIVLRTVGLGVAQ